MKSAGNGALDVRSLDLRRTISRKLPVWTDYFTFVSAIRTDARVLCSTVIKRTAESPARFLVVGDASGRLYFVNSAGDLAWEHNVGESSNLHSTCLQRPQHSGGFKSRGWSTRRRC